MEIKEKVKTRFLIVSDTHNAVPFDTNDGEHAFRQPLPDADVLIHCGDITEAGGYEEYLPTIEMLKKHPAEYKLVIAGNHDITLDKPFYEKMHAGFHAEKQDVDKVRDLWCGEEARKAGIIYLEEGVRKIGLKNGAKFTIYSSPYQPEFCGWAFPYQRNEDRYNPTSPANAKNIAVTPVPDFPNVHIMITHGPPRQVLDKTLDNVPVGCNHLMRAVDRCRPLMHCFGHIHEGWGAASMDWQSKKLTTVNIQRKQVLEDRCSRLDLCGANPGSRPLKFGQETMFINAAIMDVKYRPVNAPWLVDLNLPVG